MKKFHKKTTTKTTEHQKIRKDLCSFTTKYLGNKLPHMRKLKRDTTFNDYTLVSFATGKINTIQETKVFLVAKHNSAMPTDNTSTHALKLGKTTVYVKTNRNNPLIRTTKPEKNIMQKRSYSTNNKEIKTENKVDQVQTWSDYLYPYFTSEYYYAGQVVTTVAVVATVAVVYVYVAPAVASYWYGSSNNNPTNSPTTTNTSADAPAIHNTTDSLNIRTEEVQSVLPTEMQNTLPTSIDSEKINDFYAVDTLEEIGYSDSDIAKSNAGYERLYEACAHSKKKIENLIQNNQLDEYRDNINNKLYNKEIEIFCKEYNREQIENNELIPPEVIKDVAIIESKQENTINKDIINNLIEKLGRIDDNDDLTDDLAIVIDFLANCMLY